MKAILVALAMLQAALAASPVITSLRPRGAELGKPFTLVVAGENLVEGTRLDTPLPAAVTALKPAQRDGMEMGAGRAAAFLIELKADAAPGVYPIRIENPAGISNVLLFTIGTFPEVTEEESAAYARPHQNDTIETAEPVRSSPVVVNGTLRGPERDIFRVTGKAGERRIFEVEARRCGSAIDPVLRILDGSGKQLARNNDAPGAGLDSRIDFTFPREGTYYVEVHDARFSTQAQNFYRLKMGSYQYADGIYPLGGKRGDEVEVTFFGGNLKAPVKSRADLRNLAADAFFTTVALPGSPALPFRFAVGDWPEVSEPGGKAAAIPVVVNDRIAEAGTTKRYRYPVEAGDKLLFELQSHELGGSRIEAVITAFDEQDKKIDSAGDKAFSEDVFAVQGTSRTSSDPFLNVEVPKDSHFVTIAVEDLARRGGPAYGYRLVARRQAQDFRLAVSSPFVNIPKGGTATVTVTADRRGYEGPIQLSVSGLPNGVTAEGGKIPREYLGPNNIRVTNPRGVITLTAENGAELDGRELMVWGEGKLPDGEALRRKANGIGMAVDVTGATLQGSVDFQRPLTAPWLGLHLPASTAEPALATLEVRVAEKTRMPEGERTKFEYKWRVRTSGATLNRRVEVDIVGARDVRVTEMTPGEESGTFNVSTTKSTDPGRYDMIVTGRLTVDGREERVVSRAVGFEVSQESVGNDVASNR